MKKYMRYIILLFAYAALILITACQNGVLFGPAVISIAAGDSTGKYIHFTNTGNTGFVGFSPNIENNTSDLKFYQSFESGGPLIYNYQMNINASGSASIAANEKGALVLKAGETIDKNTQWQSGGSINLQSEDYNGRPGGYNILFGNWNDTTEGYIAFKIAKKDQTYWGWLHMLPGYHITGYAYTKY
jgi:hypothetical protein